MTALAPTLQSFFTSYLIGQRAASGHTISAYRDTFRLLLNYTRQQTGIAPNRLDIADLDAELVAGFLTMLETDRANKPRTRNARLAAIHSMFAHAALRHPEHAESIARVLAIPAKNTHRSGITYLTDPEVDALLAAPDRTTWTGRRDHLLILAMVTTGLRVSEITADEICMPELASLARLVIASGKAGDVVIVSMARELGLQRTGAAIRKRLEMALDLAVR